MTDNALVTCVSKRSSTSATARVICCAAAPQTASSKSCDRVSDVVRMRGIVNLDIYDVNGHLAVMEVNARIGGNYPASHVLGVNLLRHVFAEGVDHAVPDPAFHPVRRGRSGLEVHRVQRSIPE